MASEEHDELSDLLKESIRAANRTTHAVRAVVVPSTIILVTLLVAALPLTFAFLADSAGGFFISGLILLAGTVLAIISQINETKQSALPFSSKFPDPENQLLPPPDKCSCSSWERGVGNTSVVYGVEYCGRCRVLIQSKS